MSDSEEEFRKTTRNYGYSDKSETNDNGNSIYFSESDYGTDSDEEEKKEMVELRKKLFKVKSDNGFVLNDKYSLPEEIISLILSYMEPNDLVFNCRRVCKNWCNLIDSEVWKLQLKRYNFVVNTNHELKWVYYYWVLSKRNVFNRNLVKNNCGQDGFKHWDGQGPWIIEKPPVGCKNFPDYMDKEILNHNSCFATRVNYKFQSVDFEKEGATSKFMDIVKPKIIFTDWYCGRSDCRSYYSVTVKLIRGDYHLFDDNRDPTFCGLISRFQYRKKIGGKNGSSWQKVSHVFENYKKKGAEAVLIEEYGQDEMYRKGCYGCKVTGTSIVLRVS